MKWPVATIGEVCEVVSGATPKTGKPEFWDGDVPWVTPKDLSKLGQKHLSDTPRHITKSRLEELLSQDVACAVCSAQFAGAYRLGSHQHATCLHQPGLQELSASLRLGFA